MVKYIVIGVILFIVLPIILSVKEEKEKRIKEEEKKLKDEEKKKAYEIYVNNKLDDIKSSELKTVDSGDLILKKGEVCYVNDKTKVLSGQFYEFNSLIVTNKRIIANDSKKEVLILLKDITKISVVDSAVFGLFLSFDYYNSVNGNFDRISIHTGEDCRVIEAIIKKLIGDMEEVDME